jgi:hypothetical protein
MEHMRTLLVPPILKNGQMSTHAPKHVTVLFQDGAKDTTAREVTMGAAGKKKVHFTPLSINFIHDVYRANHQPLSLAWMLR